MTTMLEAMDKYHRVIIAALGFVVVFFALACTFSRCDPHLPLSLRM